MVSTGVLTTSKAGISITSLGSLVQCSNILTVEELFCCLSAIPCVLICTHYHCSVPGHSKKRVSEDKTLLIAPHMPTQLTATARGADTTPTYQASVGAECFKTDVWLWIGNCSTHRPGAGRRGSRPSSPAHAKPGFITATHLLHCQDNAIEILTERKEKAHFPFMARPRRSSWWDAASHSAKSVLQHLWLWVCSQELIQAQPGEQLWSLRPRDNPSLPPQA